MIKKRPDSNRPIAEVGQIVLINGSSLVEVSDIADTWIEFSRGGFLSYDEVKGTPRLSLYNSERLPARRTMYSVETITLFSEPHFERLVLEAQARHEEFLSQATVAHSEKTQNN